MTLQDCIKNLRVFSFEQHNIGVFAQMTFILLTASLCEEKKWIPYFYVRNENLRDDKCSDNWLNDFIDQKNLHEDILSEAKKRLSAGDTFVFRNRYDLNKLARGSHRAEFQNELRGIESASEIFSRHLALKPFVKRIAEDFISREFGGEPFLSVHYRGTDKFDSEAAVVSNKKMHEVMERYVDSGRIFLATDSVEFEQYCQEKFGRRVVFYRRSSGNSHLLDRGCNYTKSLDAFVDCLILSQGKVLIKTPSQLSAWSKVLNPDLQLVLVGAPVCKPHGEVHLRGAGYWPESALFEDCPEVKRRNQVIEIIH